ncbi:MAG: DNA-3-methyladenine glycosylase family protein [Alphaproteobacteria bacterium]
MIPAYWLTAVAQLRARDPILARLIDSYPDEALASRDDPFGTLARAIVGQQISVKAAGRLWHKLETAIGPVGPETVVRAGEEALSLCGLSRRKAAYLTALADRFLDGSIRPARWAGVDDEAVIQELLRIKGVGRWTAEMFLIFNLLRPDVLPLDDIGLKKAMALHYRANRPITTAEMRAIAHPWRPWRSVAVWYLWRSLDPEAVAY